MTSSKLRSLGVVPLAVAGTALLGVSSTMTPVSGPSAEVKKVATDVALLDSVLLIMGGSGEPVPPQSQIDAITDRFIDPTAPFDIGQPSIPVDGQDVLFTPEGLYPLTGVKTLALDPSVAQGVGILDNAINQQLAAGHDVVVSGYSQSSTISSLEMTQLMNSADPPDAGQLSFVLLGDPNNPDGGILSRFGDPSLPSLTIPALGEAGQGITFSGATPADTPWETAVYTGEYDGFADFPKYPLNLLADLNAIAGTQSVHLEYPSLTPDQLATAVQVPTSADYTGDTTYWMIPTQDLPILDGLREIPIIGNPLADLLQPDLKVIVNLGYGPDPDVGWSTSGANLSTPFGLFPSLDSEQFNTVVQALVTGAQQGFKDFFDDLSDPSTYTLASTGPSLDLSAALDAFTADPQSVVSGFANALSSVFASLYSMLLPAADVMNAMMTTLPAYDFALFTQELSQGNLLDAIGMPIAADVGLGAFLEALNTENINFTLSGDIPAELETYLPFLFAS